MRMNPLDNVIWQALTTRQEHFAETFHTARRFPQEVTALCAMEQPNDSGYESLAGLIRCGATGAIFLNEPYPARTGWDYVAGAPLLQMVCDDRPGTSHAPANESEIIELGPQDSADMIELTSLTKPGPFGKRTHELGFYAGIRDHGKLVAMAGERLKVSGYTEVSAVCTHPDHLGKGYAARLMLAVMRCIHQRGEIPFLHVRADNARAIALYERLGFRTRWQGHFAVLRNTKA
jgi:ribosomal protein S18 acetylase RimI-like enzyme